jgi:hypothetical protein
MCRGLCIALDKLCQKADNQLILKEELYTSRDGRIVQNTFDDV